MNRNVRFKTLDFDSIEAIIVHHSATKPSQNISAEDIDRWHRNRGWLAIGYHFVIRRDGSIQPGRLISQVGAHAGSDWNSRSIGICMIGGLNEETSEVEDNFTDTQYRSLHALVTAVNPHVPIMLHKEVSETECSMVDLSRVR